MTRGELLPAFTAACLLVSTSGCETGSIPDNASALPNGPQTPVSIQGLAMACSDCVDVRELVVLGDTTGPGYLETTSAVLLDSIGRFWVGQNTFFKVYDTTGHYIAQVGRSGEGPMEFTRAVPVKTDGSGRVHVVDALVHRETVIGADLTLLDETTLGGVGMFNHIAALPGDKYVVNAWAMTPDQIHVPLHVIEGPDVVNSFGSSEATDPRDAMKSLRLIAARGNRIATAKRFEYEVKMWDQTGAPVAILNGPRLNANEVKQGCYNRTDNPIPSEIVALSIDEEERVWVIIRQVKDDWQSHFRDTSCPDGGLGLQLKNDVSGDELYRTRIEIVDPVAGDIIAVADRPELFAAFAGSGLLVEQRTLEDGTPQVAIWNVDLRDFER